MKTNNLSKVLLAGLLTTTAFLLGCKEDASKEIVHEKSEFPRNETLYVGGFDWAPPTTFNPLDGDPNFPIDGNIRLMYESLFAYNQLSGDLEPMLAVSYTKTDSLIAVKLDPKAKWSDGSPLTVEDVAYTFYLDSIFPTPRHAIWQYISKIETAGQEIFFYFKAENKNPLVVLSALSETSILPKKIFEPLVKSSKAGKNFNYANILNFKNDSLPLVSGPYNLKQIYPDKIVLKRNDSYWGNYKYNNTSPAPKYIIHSLYNGNNHFNSAMIKGNLDISSIFLPRIWEKERDQIRSWSKKEPYHEPGSIPTLFISHTMPPFNDVAFRRALAHSINFEKIKSRAVSDYTPKMEPGFILPFGQESKFFNKEDAEKYGYSYNTEKAKKILSDAGYSWDKEGNLLNKSGAKIRPLTIECPQGWTDWEDAIKVVIESFKEIGVIANEKFIDYGAWEKDLRFGTFDLTMKTQTADLSAATPWARFDQIMNSKNIKPVGEETFTNQGRFSNKEADSLLAAIPTLSNENDLKNAYRALNRIFMTEIPVLTLMYRPTQYYQFSTIHWTNFPTEENPYAPPQNLIVAASVKALWSIKPNK